jgi:hypothetical protein
MLRSADPMLSAPDGARADPVQGLNVFTAFLLSAILGLAALLSVSRGHVDRMAYGDGLIYRYVAGHLTTPPSQIDPVVSSRGSAIRYGRIGFPALIWLASAGHNSAMPYAQAALIVLSAGLAGAATAHLFPRAGPIGALLAFIAPGFALSVVGGYGEVMAAALALWAVILASRARYWPAAALLTTAMLTRENAGAILIGLVAWELLHRRAKGAAILSTSIIPLAAWYAFIDERFGHIPLLDPYLGKTTDTIGTPFVAVWHSLTQGRAGSMATAAIHLALALIAFWLWRKSVLAIVAAAAGLQVIGSGAFAWHFIGDAMRAFTFLELFLLLTLLRYRWPEPSLPSNG